MTSDVAHTCNPYISKAKVRRVQIESHSVPCRVLRSARAYVARPYLNKQTNRIKEGGQWVNPLASKFDNLSLNPRTHMVK